MSEAAATIEIGKAIRIVRLARELRLSALAKGSGLSVPFLSLVENGERQPSLAALHRIARRLGMPGDVLIVVSQPPKGRLRTNSRKNGALVAAIRKVYAAENELRRRL